MAGERLIWKAAKSARKAEAFLPRFALARGRLSRAARRGRPQPKRA